MPRSSSHGSCAAVVEVVDDLVAPRQRRGHVQLAGHRLGGTRDPARLGQRLRRAQQRLGGHAGLERAFAADQLLLDQRDRQPPSARRPAHTSPAGPAPSTITSNSSMSLTVCRPPLSLARGVRRRRHCSTMRAAEAAASPRSPARRTPVRLALASAVMDESLAGQLLLASPSLHDPNFERSVVLIGVHSAEGAMGVVLNRPSS